MEELVVYRKLKPCDLQLLKGLIEVYEEVFEMNNFKMSSSIYLQTLLEKESMIFYTAVLDAKVIGGLTAHVLPSVYFESAEVYIYDLGVRTEYQRRGIGKKLIESLSNFCREKGFREIFVQADVVDQHAKDFYVALGGKPENVVHYTYYLQG